MQEDTTPTIDGVSTEEFDFEPNEFDFEELSDMEAAEKLLASLEDDEEDEADTEEDANDGDDAEPSDADSDEDSDDDTDADDEAEAEEDEDEAEEDESDDEPLPLAEDDAVVAIEIDGEYTEVSVAEFKQLRAQSEEITSQSASMGVQRQLVADQGQFFAGLLEKRHAEAVADAAKYADIDMFNAARTMQDDEFEALKSGKEAAEAAVAAIESEAKDFLENSRKARQDMLKAQAQEAIPKVMKAIPEWNDALYSDIRSYAVKQGMSVQAANELVDVSAIVMINKARQFDALQEAASKVRKKVKAAPKRVLKKGDKPTNKTKSKSKVIHDNALITGDVEDVAAAFAASLED